MIVLKFGGTSVGSTESLKQVKEIVSDKSKSDILTVVVSAFSDITNTLVDCSFLAASGDASYEEKLALIEKRHIEVCNQLIPVSVRSHVLTRIKLLLNDLEDICRGVFLIKELSPRSSDNILGFGELLSSVIIYEFFKTHGADVRLIDPRELIKTDGNHGNAVVDQELTYSNIQAAFVSAPQISICPGFIASSKHDNHTTTLGRGGSDYTAALLAAALESSCLEIWTDVSGMMTTNPKLVPLAHPIKRLTYEEAMELSHFGAKVIYPPTIQPVLDKHIPILIKNTFAPDDEGTFITSEEYESDKWVKGISSIDEVALCTLSGSGMVAVPNFSFRLFRALSRVEVNVILITQASSEHTITVGISINDTERARNAIEEEFVSELKLRKVDPIAIETSLSIIALVGSKMRQQVGVSANLFETLSHNGINVRAIAQGSTELNISVVIDKKHLRKALNSIHESFFLSDLKKYNLFMIGVGNVGKSFLEQVSSQQQYLAEQYQLDLKVAGIANSKKMLFNEDGIHLENWKFDLLEHGVPMSLNGFVEKMESFNLRNSIFIDCTASSEIPKVYKNVLSHSISVVTPNKIACSSKYQHYQELNATAKSHKAKLLYETNVGAGLPVISTLNDLIKSGDQIHTIKAVLSGTLNFIFNNYNGTQKFSEVVRAAHAAGYTEPDPRIDLSGVDVMRKILILARESGAKLELEDIHGEAFVPEECMRTNTIEEFYSKLDEFDHVFQNIYKKASEQGKRLKFVASFDKGSAKAGLEAFGPEHPFYELQGKDNIVLFHTTRYKEQPLVVKGAGAGSDVTASGIFADVMRIASA